MVVFDQFAKNYDEGHDKAVAISGFKSEHFHEYKLQEVVAFLKKKNLDKKKLNFLDFGCGIGRSAEYVKKYLPNAHIYGVDVSKEEIKVAKENTKALRNVNFSDFDGVSIPFKEKFDVIFVANVFHHIKRENQQKVMESLEKSLAPGGHLFIFEHNPLNPLTIWVYLANDFKFDKDSNLLSAIRTRTLLNNVGLFENETFFRVFFPNFLSPLIKYEKFLGKIPFGAHYYFVAKKNA